MDFNDTPEEARFRTEVRAWLEGNAQPLGGTPTRAADMREALSREREWQGTKADAGYAGITWPRAQGGRGGTVIQQVIYDQEEACFDVPRQGFFGIGLQMVLPTLITYATPVQLRRFVQPILRGEELWCQLFSEPAGGSDLAALRTRAARDGDDWVINGQKVWTSFAQYADWAILIARSDPSKPKHAGLTFFFLDMKSPGIDVRPIRQITGGSEFNEVFFSDVRIPDAQRLGDIDGGWKVALTTLGFERGSSGGRVMGAPDAAQVIDLARRVEFLGKPALEDGRVRERIADWWLRSRGLELTTCRALTALSRGQTPGPEFSIGKLISATQMIEVSGFMMELLGVDSLALPRRALMPEDLMFPWLFGSGMRIAAGTDEIMKNILAERVLGLPPEPRGDRETPFSELKS